MYRPAKVKYKVINFDYPNSKARWLDKETGLRKNYDGTLEQPKFMKTTHKGALTTTQKRVVAKLMYEAGWGSKRLAEWFKKDSQTILKWKKLPTPDSLKEFEQRFKAAMLDYDMESTFNIKSRINQLIPEENDINKLVKAGEFFSGEKERRSTQNNTQINVYADMLKKYKEEVTS